MRGLTACARARARAPCSTQVADLYRPKLLVAGFSAYSRTVDYKRMREIADKHDALFLFDMAHISGLVAGGVVPSPFPYADIVTTTTHKSLRGPRGAIIFFRRGERLNPVTQTLRKYDLEERINFSVFPGFQGGPHNHTISAIAVALELARTPEFKAYQQRVVRNAKALADGLMARGYRLATGGTDNHLMLVDLREKKITGSKVEKICDFVNITLNKNTIAGDKSAMNPGAVRVGTPAMTTRGFTERDFDRVAGLLDRVIKISLEIQDKASSKSLKDFLAVPKPAALLDLREEVKAWTRTFPTVGFEEATMMFK